MKEILPRTNLMQYNYLKEVIMIALNNRYGGENHHTKIYVGIDSNDAAKIIDVHLNNEGFWVIRGILEDHYFSFNMKCDEIWEIKKFYSSFLDIYPTTMEYWLEQMTEDSRTDLVPVVQLEYHPEAKKWIDELMDEYDNYAGIVSDFWRKFPEDKRETTHVNVLHMKSIANTDVYRITITCEGDHATQIFYSRDNDIVICGNSIINDNMKIMFHRFSAESVIETLEMMLNPVDLLAEE